MVPCGAVLWRRLLRKRWVLGVVFGLSLVYFLSSTFKQVGAGGGRGGAGGGRAGPSGCTDVSPCRKNGR